MVDELLIRHLHGHADSRRPRPLAGTGLEHPELLVLDGELDVLHVRIVLLKLVTDREELLVGLGPHLFEGLDRLLVGGLRLLVQRQRGADTRHHVFALGVDEPLAVEHVFAIGRVTRERHTRRRGVAQVTEYHGLHVNRRAQSWGMPSMLR